MAKPPSPSRTDGTGRTCAGVGGPEAPPTTNSTDDHIDNDNNADHHDYSDNAVIQSYNIHSTVWIRNTFFGHDLDFLQFFGGDIEENIRRNKGIPTNTCKHKKSQALVSYSNHVL